MNVSRFLTARILSVTLIGMSAGVAQAGDFATLNVLGFSQDGSIFAFEEYGIQDGSGFPYANRFYIDTASDSFVSGTPIRERIDDEGATLDDARDAAAETGSAIIEDDMLKDGFAAGVNAVTEASADPFRMAVNPRPVVPPIDEEIEFRLKEQRFTASETCAGILETSSGFTLTQIATTPEQTTRILHADESVPSSRSCPTGYRIGGVYTYFPQSGTPVYAVMIAVQSYGFEGPDYRWMAVTTPQ